MKKLCFLFLPLLFVALYVIATEVGPNEGFERTDSSFDQYNEYRSYGVTATAQSGWHFVGGDTYSRSGWELVDKPDDPEYYKKDHPNASASVTVDDPLGAPDFFSLALDGYMVTSSGDGGSKKYWSIIAEGFYIHSGDEYVEVISPWGEDATFSASGGEETISWTVTRVGGGDGNIPDPLADGRTLAIGATGADGENPVNPGEYTVIATDKNSLTDSMALIILKVASVVWKNGDDSTITNDNPNPGGEKRIFPGKTEPDDTKDRRTVKIEATLTHKVEDITVYFKIFDVDDPSSKKTPIDDESQNADNFGTAVPSTIFEATTDEDGVAEIEYAVSMQPGDNFKTVASVRQDFFDGMKAEQGKKKSRVLDKDKKPVSSDNITKMLTVWRKIHIEVDIMKTPTFAENIFKGRFYSYEDDGKYRWFEYGRMNSDPSNVIMGGGKSYWQDGSAKFEFPLAGGTASLNLFIIDSERNFFSYNRIKVRKKNSNILKGHWGNITLGDDDFWDKNVAHRINGTASPAFSTGTFGTSRSIVTIGTSGRNFLKSVYSPAYMTVKFHDNLMDTYSFDPHTPATSASLAFFGKKNLSGGNTFYVVNVKIVFQPGTGSDADPFNDFFGHKLGLTKPLFSRERCIIYAETIKDSIVSEIPQTDIEIGAITAHEIMHLMRNNETHDATGLGAAESTSSDTFADEAIAEIRKNSAR